MKVKVKIVNMLPSEFFLGGSENDKKWTGWKSFKSIKIWMKKLDESKDYVKNEEEWKHVWKQKSVGWRNVDESEDEKK